jgi:hypothetical protein
VTQEEFLCFRAPPWWWLPRRLFPVFKVSPSRQRYDTRQRPPESRKAQGLILLFLQQVVFFLAVLYIARAVVLIRQSANLKRQFTLGARPAERITTSVTAGVTVKTLLAAPTCVSGSCHEHLGVPAFRDKFVRLH